MGLREVDFIFGVVAIRRCYFAFLFAVGVPSAVFLGQRGGRPERTAFPSWRILAVRAGCTAFLFRDVVTPFSYEFRGKVGNGGVGMGAGAVDDDTNLGGTEEVFVGAEIEFQVVEDGQNGAWGCGSSSGFL